MVTMQVIRQRKTARDTGAVIDPRGECVVFLLSTAPPLLSGGSRTGYFSGDCFASGVLGADSGGATVGVHCWFPRILGATGGTNVWWNTFFAWQRST